MYVGAVFFFFQAEDGIRDLVRSRGLGDVYKRQAQALERLNETDGRHQIQQRDEIHAHALSPAAGALSLIHI